MFKSVQNWMPGYLASVLRRPKRPRGLRHLMVAVCDHFEPYRGGTDKAEARRIVREWTDVYPASVAGFRDADGCTPRHTFFYPEEEYDEAILDRLAQFCRRGFGEVEIHLHHRNDTPEGLRRKLVQFRNLLHERHGLLGRMSDHATDHRSPMTDHYSPSYGFIHGNWALCNARPDGDWCGVNEELGILSGTGCYADFTFPSAPSSTQPRMVNAIYYAKDKRGKPRGADRGERVSVEDRHKTTDHRLQTSDIRQKTEDLIEVEALGGRDLAELDFRQDVSRLRPSGVAARQAHGVRPPGRSEVCSLKSVVSPLMLITGPLALNWRRRKWRVFPRLENSEISGGNPPTPDRARLWVKQSIGVAGRPEWLFVKLHTHGCVPENARVLLGERMREMHAMLQREYNDGVRWQLHYVTAREMYNLVKAAEAGKPGSPGLWRDWLVRSPPVLSIEHDAESRNWNPKTGE